MKKVSVAMVVILSLMMMSSTLFAAEMTYSDMPAKDNWSYQGLAHAVDNNLMRGYQDQTIRPNNDILRTEMAVMMFYAYGAPAGNNDVLKQFNDVDFNAWYCKNKDNELARTVQMKIFQGNGNGTLNPTGKTSREESFVIIANAFKVSPLNTEETSTVLASFADKDKIANWAQPYAAALVKAGYLKGTEVNGKLYMNPKQNITRAEFASLMDRFVQLYVDEQKDVPTKDFEGTILVRNGDVNFGNINISGNLILGEGLDGTLVILDGTKIKGDTIVRQGETAVPVKTATIANETKHEVPEVGDVLVASYGPENAAGPIVYQWQYLDGDVWQDIAGATKANYTITKDVLGKELHVIVTGAQDFRGVSEKTEKVVTVATEITNVKKALWSNTATPNAENVNAFMDTLWAKEDGVFSFEKGILTIHCNNITNDMKTFIQTNWGGSSVPVALDFNGTVVNGLEKDSNWSNGYLDWIDLKDTIYNGEVTRTLAEGTFSYDAKYVGAYASKIDTLSQPVWTGETPNAKEVNALMTALWDDKTGVFSSEGNNLTIDITKITKDMTDKIAAFWGGASVPVTLVLNGDVMKSGSKDENWDSSYLDWINLNDAVTNGTVVRAYPSNKNFKYNVTYINGKEYAAYFDTIEKAVWSNTETPNAADVNALMDELWAEKTGVFQCEDKKLTIHVANITQDMKTKIKTYWGGASVPVKLVFDQENALVKGLTRDANWSNAYLDWINLDDAINDSNANKTVARMIPGSIDNYGYSVKYYLKTSSFMTLEKAVWSNTETPNAADVNALMDELWNENKGVFRVADTVLTIQYDNITKEMKEKIKAYWGGSSVPVKLVFDKEKAIAEGLTKDANWSNAYLDWINLDDATEDGEVERKIPNSLDDYSYSVEYVGLTVN